MIRFDKYCKNVALPILIMGGLVGFVPALQAHGHSGNSVRAAQEKLRDDGYYKGNIDGANGPATSRAIRQYQRDKDLSVTGTLDRETRKKLGLRDKDDDARNTGEADRVVGEADRSQPAAVAAPSSAAVSAAQRRLRDKGFYKGDVDGNMKTETRAAIREYQKNSNLNVTGKLDQGTLSSLGVSK